MVGLWAGDSLHSNNVVLAFAPTVMKLITTAPGCWNGADARSTQGDRMEGVAIPAAANLLAPRVCFRVLSHVY